METDAKQRGADGSPEDGKKLELVALLYPIISKSGQEELERMS